MVRLDRVHFTQSYPNGLSASLNYDVLNTRAKRVAIDDWYDNNFLDTTLAGVYIRDNSANFIERNDKGGSRWLLCNTPCPLGMQGDVNGKGMKMRIADFNAVAYFMWGVDPNILNYNSSMKSKLEVAVFSNMR